MNKKEILHILENTPIDKMGEILFYLNHHIEITKEDMIQAISEYNHTHNRHIYNNLQEEFGRTFERMKDSFSNKFMNTTFFRNFIKEISKNITFKYVSKSKFQHMISLMATDIISTCCIFSLKNKYEDNYLELFIKTISDENILKNEFIEVIKRDIFPIITNDNPNLIKKEGYFDSYCDVHAKYLLEFEKESTSNQLLNYKQEIQKLFTYTPKEIEKKKHEENKKQIQTIIDKHEDFDPEDFINYIEDKIIEELKEKYNTEIVDFLIDNGYDSIQYHHSLDTVISKLQSVYKEFFMYDNQDKFIDYLKRSLTILLSIESINENNETLNLTNFLYLCVEEVLYKIFENTIKVEDEEDEEAKHSIIIKLTNDALELLAYGILYSHDYDKNIEGEILEEFKEIMQTNKKAKELYHSLLEDYFQKHMDTLFSPVTNYKLAIVKSVLMCIDDKYVYKKVRKILLNRNPFLFDKNSKIKLNELTKKQANLYDNNYNMYLISNFHEFAVTFLLTYMSKNLYVAPNTAFMYFVQDCLNEFNFLNFHDLINVFKHILEEDEENETNKPLLEIYQNIEELIKEIVAKCEDEEYLHKYLFPYQKALEAKKISPAFYLKFSNVEELLNKYKYELLYTIYLYSPKEKNDFFDLSFDYKANYLLQICIYMLFSEELQEATDLFPSVSELNLDKEISLLKDNINELESTLRQQSKDYDSLQKEFESYKNTQEDIKNKEIKQISTSYKNEISTLYKQLSEKERKVQELKENESELYKLRALMFSLQSDSTNFESNEEIDLLPYTNKYSITLVGGHIRLIDRLKSKYPKLRFVSNETTVNESVLETSDFIFILYNFLDHNTYYRVMNIINRKPTIKWDYIAFTNINKVEYEIFNKINELNFEK